MKCCTQISEVVETLGKYKPNLCTVEKTFNLDKVLCNHKKHLTFSLNLKQMDHDFRRGMLFFLNWNDLQCHSDTFIK